MKRGLGTVSGPQTGQPAADFVPPTPAELAGRFPEMEILELVGRGGMGMVYKARQKRLDRLVALKILLPHIARDEAFAERFAREARAMAMLSHPNIVAVYDFGQAVGHEETLYYFLMEYVDGPTLREVLESGKLAPAEALAIVPQICEALQYAHDHGVVHRDIKPANMLIDRQGRVKIADFGLAKLVGQTPHDFSLTGTGQVMGTPHYMAPEQMEHPQTVDHRADIYSLGVVFYQMLTGELPLGRFAPPSKRVAVDVRLDDVVLRTLEREPELRYQQARQVKTEVETIAGTPSPTPRLGRLRRFGRRVRERVWTRKTVWTLLVAVVVALLVRTFVIEVFWTVGDSVSPEIPQGSYAMVFKLVRSYRPGDIIVYREEGRALLARVAAAGPTPQGLLVERSRQTPRYVPAAAVAGRVILNTRPFEDKKTPPASVAPASEGQSAKPAAGPTRDQMLVEDQALLLLAAIRDKDDAALRRMSTDLLPGWRKALPQFAFELRERVRAKTGKPLSLTPTESLVEGRLAVVKCTGPKGLEGVYLVLYFVNTDQGWRNWMLRNGPPSKPLADFLKEKPPASNSEPSASASGFGLDLQAAKRAWAANELPELKATVRYVGPTITVPATPDGCLLELDGSVWMLRQLTPAGPQTMELSPGKTLKYSFRFQRDEDRRGLHLRFDTPAAAFHLEAFDPKTETIQLAKRFVLAPGTHVLRMGGRLFKSATGPGITLWSNPVTIEIGAEPRVAILEFRIVPNPPQAGRKPAYPEFAGDTKQPFAEAAVKELAQKGPAAAQLPGRPFAWFEVAASARAPGILTGDYHGKRYALLCNQPPYAVPAAAEGPNAWGVKDVSAGKHEQAYQGLNLELDRRGGELLRDLTAANRGNWLAVLLNGRVLWTSMIATPLGDRLGVTLTPDQVAEVVGVFQTAIAEEKQ
jgi:tRNA A-37 threonylcarbamoyl transferase component Bud32